MELPLSALVTTIMGTLNELMARSLPGLLPFTNWVAFKVTLQPTPMPRGSLTVKSLKLAPPWALAAWMVCAAPVRTQAKFPVTMGVVIDSAPPLMVAVATVGSTGGEPFFDTHILTTHVRVGSVWPRLSSER